MADADDATANEAGGRSGGRSWWLWDDREETARPSKSRAYADWQPSLELLSDALDGAAVMDGILGFSQGATLMALFLALVQKGEVVCERLPRFAIFVGGFMPHDEKIAREIEDGRPSMDGLHIYGTTDTFVSPPPKNQSHF